MQKDSKLLDDITKLGTAALGATLEWKRELDALISAKFEAWLQKMQLPTREELEVVRDMAIKAREENDNLKKDILELRMLLGKHN